MLKIGELFAGIGSQTQALKNIGVEHEVAFISEIDKYAVKSYEAIHGEVNNLGDIKEIYKMPYVDLLTYSFPCFVEDTLIMTSCGYKKIQDIKKNNLVLTHKNRFKKVIKPMSQKASRIYNIDCMCSETIKATEEHPFYVRRKQKIWDNENRTYKRVFNDPEWVEVKNLSKDYYLGLAVNQNSLIPKWDGVDFKWSDGRKDRKSNVLNDKFRDVDFWWVIGRYIGDGWLRSQGGIIICGAKHEIKEIEEKIQSVGFNFNTIIERTVGKIHVPIKELGIYLEQFGRGAKNKRLTNDIFDLPIELLRGFIEGYLSADGCETQSFYKVSSVSQELVYGLGQCILKAYNKPYSIYKTKRKSKCIIEGRTVNQNDTYEIKWKLDKRKQDKAFFENGYAWIPLNKIEKKEYSGLVYNMEVDGDNSYTVNNIIVHNCQDLSVAGKQAGINKNTRSGLLYEVERLLNVSEKPKYLLLENVKNLLGKKHKADFEEWLKTLEKMGYHSYWQVLNAKDYGIPQNRERVFVVSSLEKIDYKFPKKEGLKLKLKDMLESGVDEKFYIKNPDVLFNTSNSSHIGMLNIKGNEQIRRVYSQDGISPTLNTMQGGNRQPKVLIKNATKKGYLEAVDGDGIDLSCPDSKTRMGRVQSQSCHTITTSDNLGVLNDYRIRKLTPKECWRLMGFKDEQFKKAEKVNSNTQLYKQAGNSIVVNVLEEIFKCLFC